MASLAQHAWIRGESALPPLAAPGGFGAV